MNKEETNNLDIALAWQKMAEKKFSQSKISKEEIMDAIKKESHSNIAELKKGLKIKLIWSGAFTLAFTIALFFFIRDIDMVVLLGFIIVAYAIGFILMYTKYKQINEDFTKSFDILQSMKYNARMIKAVFRLEKIWGILVFIPSITIAVLAGKVLTGISLMTSLQDSKTLSLILGAILIITPILIWATDKMNQVAMGNNLKSLENNIVKMETLQ